MKRSRPTAVVAAAVGAACAALSLGGGGCTPDIPRDPVPQAMEFDPEAMPPRVPQPTGLIINRQTGRIDLSLAGTPVPADCATLLAGEIAECEFNQYLQSLDGFPTVTPASAPATAALDLATLTAGTNVVVTAAKGAGAGAGVDVEVAVGFDTAGRQVTVRPRSSWDVGETYWLGVRGYGAGVRTADGGRVVGSATQYLLKQETPLTCGAANPSALDPACPAFALLSQTRPADEAAASLFQLEGIRLAYIAGGGWDLMAAAGLPKEEVAVLWGFPIHSASVAELDPTAGLVPKATAVDEIRIAVNGTVASATVTPFIPAVQFGTVVFMDLTAAQGGNLVTGFPAFDVTVAAGEIVIKGRAPFVAGHQYGVFMLNGIHDAAGAPLVPSPVSVLLRLRGALVDKDAHSTIPTVSDGDAAMLEAGRLQLATLFDTPTFASLTRVMREQLVYCFAFPFGVAP
ncbi:MAG: hypothetical protein ABUS79_08690 [Pseudomonadota bacterium]